ncbi:MAG: ABC transporter substrate-binding protein, partial [Candidatus Bathyarchaeia archaeon]
MSENKTAKKARLVLAIVVAFLVVASLIFYLSTQKQAPTGAVTTAKPFHKQILYIIVNDEGTRINMYKTGVFDIAVVTPARWPDVNNTKVGSFYLHLVRRPDKPQLTIQYIGLNPMKEPLNIPEVRQALAYATPYDVILKQVFGGLYTRLYTIIPKGMLGYTEFGINKYEYDMNKAQQIISSLKAKGFDPSKYVITITYNEGNTARQQIATLLQQSWSQLGFKVTVESYSWPKYLDLTDHFEHQVMLLGWIPDYMDPDDYLMPFVWGGAEFKDLEYHADVPPANVGNYLSSVNMTIETEKYIVVVGEKGTGAKYTGPTNKPIITVGYVVDWDTTNSNWQNPVNMVTLGTGGLKDVALSALCKVAQRILEENVREAVIQAA